MVIVGGALGALTAAMMARLGYKVALVERIKFGRMNREWNISRSELQTLVDVGLLTADELETLIAREYQDNFNHFLAAIIHQPLDLPFSIRRPSSMSRWIVIGCCSFVEKSCRPLVDKSLNAQSLNKPF